MSKRVKIALAVALLFALYCLSMGVVYYNETNNAEVLVKLDEAESKMDDGVSKWAPGNPVAERYKAQVAMDKALLRTNQGKRNLFASLLAANSGLNIWASGNDLHLRHSRGVPGSCWQTNAYIGREAKSNLRSLNFRNIVVHDDHGTARCPI